jgi:hypothetical protein
MNPTYDFRDQLALVTGAAAGIGLDTARAFAASGAAVVLADVDEEALSTATGELTAAGHQALGVVCDVADEGQVAGLVERTVAEFGRLGRRDGPADRQARTGRGDRRRRPVALQPGRQLRPRRRPARRRRLHRAMRRRRHAIALALLATISPSACGGDEDRETGGASDASTPSPPPSAPPASGDRDGTTDSASAAAPHGGAGRRTPIGSAPSSGWRIWPLTVGWEGRRVWSPIWEWPGRNGRVSTREGGFRVPRTAG